MLYFINNNNNIIIINLGKVKLSWEPQTFLLMIQMITKRTLHYDNYNKRSLTFEKQPNCQKFLM